MEKRKYYIAISAFCLSLFLISCHQQADRQHNGSNNDQLEADGFIIKPGHFESQLDVTANLMPSEFVEIKAPVAGTVMRIHFKEGQEINKGQSLIQIDDRVWKAQIKGFKAQLTAAKEELERKKDLLDAEGASKEEVELSESTVQQLEAQIEELSVYVSLAAVPAPFDGRIGMRDFSEGAYLSQGQTITRITRSAQLKVDFNLPGRYISQLTIGKKVQIIADGDSLMAPIYAINPVVDENARTVQIRAILNNSGNWLPGDFAEVSLILDTNDSALTVPTELIVPELGAETVFLCKNGKAVKQTVITGPRNERVVEVLSGISAGDTLLSTGLLQVREGMAVKINKLVSSVEL